MSEGTRTPDVLSHSQPIETPKSLPGKDYGKASARFVAGLHDGAPELPADLARAAAAWDKLPLHIRSAILLLVDGAGW